MPAGIYARYSTDEQRPTSINDQVRRCRETAAKKGFQVEDKFVFTDEAISGAEKGIGKRQGFIRLKDAIECGVVDVLIIDDVSRASRTLLEGAELASKVGTIGLRIITSDGLDSTDSSFDVLWSVKLITAAQQVQGTATQVVRGMVGQLERGFQIAQAPFGYQARRVIAEGGRDLGATWDILEPEAKIIRQLFDWRRGGKSVAKIAAELNLMQLLPPCHQRCKGSAYWRPATVYRLLSNPIYRGVFIWNDSAFSKAKAKKRRKVLVSQEFPRPNLRLVSDEAWNTCNTKSGKTKIRGGGKQALAGLLKCGFCHAVLSISGSKDSKSAYCPQCEQAKRVGGHENFIGYSSLAAAKLALQWALEQVFSPTLVDEFRRRLQARLTQGPAKEEAELRRQLEQSELTLQRLKRLILDPSIDEDELRSSMTEVMAKKKEAQGALNALQMRSAQVTKSTVELQSKINPLPLIQKLLDGEPEAYKVRATLKRLIERFELVAKPRRNCSVFELSLSPGLAWQRSQELMQLTR